MLIHGFSLLASIVNQESHFLTGVSIHLFKTFRLIEIWRKVSWDMSMLVKLTL